MCDCEACQEFREIVAEQSSGFLTAEVAKLMRIRSKLSEAIDVIKAELAARGQ